MTDRQKLLRRIQIYDFALVDTILYLDGHPKCKKALEYYDKYIKLKEAAVEEYTTNYGPLTAYQNKNDDLWMWVTTPFPWELEAEV